MAASKPPFTLFCILSFLILAVTVLAQDIPNFPTCAQPCADTAAANSGCTNDSASCLCNSPSFQSSTLQCASTSCTIEDYSSAIGAMQQYCANTGTTTSSTTSTTGTTSSTGPVTSSSSTGPSTPPKQTTSTTAGGSTVTTTPPLATVTTTGLTSSTPSTITAAPTSSLGLLGGNSSSTLSPTSTDLVLTTITAGPPLNGALGSVRSDGRLMLLVLGALGLVVVM